MLQSGEVSRWLAKRVAEARESVSMTQADLARELGLTPQGYNPYERHGRYTVEMLLKISEITGRSVQWLLGIETGLSEEDERLLTAMHQIGESVVRDVVLLVAQHHARLSVEGLYYRRH